MGQLKELQPLPCLMGKGYNFSETTFLLQNCVSFSVGQKIPLFFTEVTGIL